MRAKEGGRKEGGERAVGLHRRSVLMFTIWELTCIPGKIRVPPAKAKLRRHSSPDSLPAHETLGRPAPSRPGSQLPAPAGPASEGAHEKYSHCL